MRLLFNFFSVIVLPTRAHARPLFAVVARLGDSGGDKMPKDMFYRMYAFIFGRDQDDFQNFKSSLGLFD